MSHSMWDDRYSANDYFYGTAPNEFVRSHANAIPLGKVLCLAEGEGRNAVHLASLGFKVTAMDQSPVGLRKASALALAQKLPLETQVGDLASFEIGTDAWDGIVSVFAHLPRALRAALHKRVVAGLKPGGLFLLEAYTPAQIAFGTGGPKDPDLLMSRAALVAELNGLEFLLAQEIERVVVEGRGHTGMASVVQILARKS